MANFFDMFKNSRRKKVIPLVLVLDTSGSMSGERIKHLNEALNALLEKISNYNKDDKSNMCIKVAILGFSSGSKWLTDDFVDPVQFCLPTITASGVTDLGCALNELNKKIISSSVSLGVDSFTSASIIFVTDGMPTDNYSIALEKLLKNNCYKMAKKYAIAIGEETDRDILKKLVDGYETIVHLSSSYLLKKTLIGLCTDLNIPADLIINEQAIIPPPALNNKRNSPNNIGYHEMSANRPAFDSDAFCTSNIASHKAEFDSHEFCTSNFAPPEAEFDSDEVCYTCALNEHDHETGAQKGTITAPVCATSDYSYSASPRANNDDLQPPQMSRTHSKIDSSGIVQCHTCGSFVRGEQKFCMKCGALIQQDDSKKVNVSQVQFSAVVPKKIVRDEYSMIDIVVYEEMYRNIVERVIKNADEEVKEVIGSSKDITANTMITIKLSSPDIQIEDCEETQKWQGKYLTFSFPVEIPGNYAKKQILFIASVYFNDVIATKLKFVINCVSSREQKISLTREDVLTAFISYASQDRSRVATIIQGMQKARPDMDIFFDVERLRSGEDWESRLRKEIECRDVLFLCWSNFAKNSEWVEKEWKYALLNKGLDSIEPVPLVSPVECPPPEELKSKHFNDRALLYKDIQ